MTITALPNSDRSTTRSGGSVAETIESAVRSALGADLPVRLSAWDGSSAGPEDAPRVRLNSPAVLRRVLWSIVQDSSGELGAAQAYVTGELDIDGNLGESLTALRQRTSKQGLNRTHLTPRSVATLIRTARSLGAFGRPLPAPASQAQIRGRLHSLARDAKSISHHYDFSNAFYQAILDPNMAYSSGYYARPEMSLEQAQDAKLDMICRKLGLEPGMRLLDVGCGWGSLSVYAAKHYQVDVVGVTIAAEQKRFIDQRLINEPLATGGSVDIRLQDYREVHGTFDAVASIEMGEHVGQHNYPTYIDVLRRSVRPGGRVLIQQMSRRGRYPGGGPFIESFIAPDMYMRPVGETIEFIEAGGLEVRDVHAMREHYVCTVRDWLVNFEEQANALRDLVGEEQLRVWRLYLVGGALAFRDGRMGVDQILAVRNDEYGHNQLPSTRKAFG